MIALVPSWAHHYNEFWEAIKIRNLWFIKLRYAAVLMLVCLRILPELIDEVQLTSTQKDAIQIITLVILLYNFLFHYSRKYLQPVPGRYNPLHLSLTQIVFDFTALMLLVYFTGSIENPLYMFFIFHMIIGSLILPGHVIYSIAAGVVLTFFGITYLEYFGLLEHHGIKGLLNYPIYNEFYFVSLFNVIFLLMMFTSVYLANKIAKQLYKRERQLKETIDKLNEAEIAKQKYLMGVVHEIKSPIAAVQSFLDLILDGFVGSVSKTILEKIKKARLRSDEAIQMINNVLRISKLKQLDIISDEQLMLDEIINKIINNYSAKANRKNLTILFDDTRDDKSFISGDTVLIELALSNLIGNSVKYARDEGNIIISLKGNTDFISLDICDDGIGIPSDELEKIFDQFYRASNIARNEFEGSGLGLSLVKEIIERHGGFIKVISPSKIGNEDYPGTCFKIQLPKAYLERKPENDAAKFQEYLKT